MSRIKDELKEQANKLLPDESVKHNIKKELGIANKKKKRSFSTAQFAMTACCLAVIVVSLSVGLSFLPSDSNGINTPTVGSNDTYLSIDINPSFEIITNEANFVIDITALNKDAVLVMKKIETTLAQTAQNNSQPLLAMNSLTDKNMSTEFPNAYKSPLVGKTITECTEHIIKASIELGYIIDGQKISILASNSNQEKEQSFLLDLSKNLEAIINKLDSTWSVVVVVKNDSVQSTGDISKGKQALIDEICDKFDIDEDDIEDWSVEKLNQFLHSYDKEEIEDFEEILDALDDSLEDCVEDNFEVYLENITDAFEDYIEYLDDKDEDEDDIDNDDSDDDIDNEDNEDDDDKDDDLDSELEEFGEFLEESLEEIEDALEDKIDEVMKQYISGKIESFDTAELKLEIKNIENSLSQIMIPDTLKQTIIDNLNEMIKGLDIIEEKVSEIRDSLVSRT